MHYYYSLLQKIEEHKQNKNEKKGNILMFHEIKKDLTKCHDENCALKPRSFETLVSSFVTKVKIGHINNIELETDPFNVITFDDAYEEVFSFAYPILKSNNLPFTIFVTYELIDKKGYLTTSMINELANDNLCTIGSHTLTHPILRKCNGVQAQREIKESKLLLEKKIGKDVKYFAYPYGSIYACSLRDINLAKAAGYEMAFSTLNAPVTEFNLRNKFFIPRININEKNYVRVI